MAKIKITQTKNVSFSRELIVDVPVSEIKETLGLGAGESWRDYVDDFVESAYGSVDDLLDEECCRWMEETEDETEWAAEPE